MKLKKYNTLSDWDTAKSGLVYPSVGLIEEDSSVVYMPPPPPPPIHTLPIKAVFYDSATGKMVYTVTVTSTGKSTNVTVTDVCQYESSDFGSGEHYDFSEQGTC